MRSLTVAQLKLELRARDLSTAGRKADLIARIVASLEERDTVPTPEAQTTEHDFEEEDRMLTTSVFTGATVTNGHAVDAPLSVAALPLD